MPDDVWPHLEHALPAAISHNLSILVGIWTTTIENDTTALHDTRFNDEVRALAKAIDIYGCHNIAAVSVGNEDLNELMLHGRQYLYQATANKLAEQIAQVRWMMRSKSCCVPVTHTDTWNTLQNASEPYVATVSISDPVFRLVKLTFCTDYECSRPSYYCQYFPILGER